MPCDAAGNFLPLGPPPPEEEASTNPWEPFERGSQFRVADLLFHDAGMSKRHVDMLLKEWALECLAHGHTGPFALSEQMYTTIDSIEFEGSPWSSFTVEYTGAVDSNSPQWKKTVYEVHYCDPDAVVSQMLANLDFDGQFDYVPYIEIGRNGQRHWSDFMSANCAWRQSVCCIFIPFLCSLVSLEKGL